MMDEVKVDTQFDFGTPSDRNTVRRSSPPLHDALVLNRSNGASPDSAQAFFRNSCYKPQSAS